jgi:hypothetical protein
VHGSLRQEIRNTNYGMLYTRQRYGRAAGTFCQCRFLRLGLRPHRTRKHDVHRLPGGSNKCELDQRTRSLDQCLHPAEADL